MATANSPDPGARHAVTAVFLANGLAVASFVVRVPDVRDQLGLREATLGVVLSSLAVGVVVGLVLSGRLAARHGSRRLTLGGAAGAIVFLPLAGLAPGPIALAAVLLLIGASAATMDVGMNAQGVGVERGYGRSVMLGLHGAWSLGSLLAALLGSLAMGAGISVAPHLGVVSVVVLLLVLVSASGLRIEDRVATVERPRFALPRGPLLPLAFVAFAAALGESTAGDWSGIHLADDLAVAPGRVGWGFVAATTGMTTIRLIGDQAVRRFGAPVVVAAGGGLATLGFVVVALGSSFWPTLAAFAAVGLGVGVTIPLTFAAAGAQSTSPGAGVAAVATVGHLAFVLGPPTVGVVADAFGLRVAFLLVAVLIGTLTVRRHASLVTPAATTGRT
ncbi:MAG: MFS transporter [Nitriliruptoraceae bacterium]